MLRGVWDAISIGRLSDRAFFGRHLRKERVQKIVHAVSGADLILDRASQVYVDDLAERLVSPGCTWGVGISPVADRAVRVPVWSATRPTITVGNALHQREERLDLPTDVAP